MAFLSRWLKPSVKQLKKKGDVDGLAKELQARLETKSLLNLQEIPMIISHLNRLADHRGIEFLPDYFRAILCSEATSAELQRLGLAALQSVGNKADASHLDALHKIETSLDTTLNALIEVETAAPTLTQLQVYTQKKAVLKELRQEITTLLSNDSFVDPRDRQVYKTLKIGNQVWMAENLNVETKNGTKKILGVFLTIDRTSWCNENKPENLKRYGRLYTWEAAINVCPPGWHLPTKEEWEILYMFLGGNGNRVYNAVKEGGSCGFNALLAGQCYDDGKFSDIENIAFFWSSTAYSDADAWHFNCCTYPRTATISHSYRKCGYSVRLLRN